MLQNFPKGNITSGGKEFNINSPFEEDTKHKFWMNIRTGQWQCFKSHKRGNFAQFVSLTTGRNYREVEAELLFKTFLNPPENYSEQEDIPTSKFISEELLATFDELDTVGDHLHQKAVSYLLSRRMFSRNKQLHNKFYVCTDGLYKDRLIIPYFIDNVRGENMYYFQSRSLSKDHHPKYLNCKQVKSSHVLYPYDDTSTEPLYITEGAFDARALQLHGLNATSTLSCSVSNIQLDSLKEYQGQLVVVYDSDTAGLDGLKRFDRLRKRKCMEAPKYVFPPCDVNDWAELHMNNPKDLVEYIEDNIKDLDFLVYL